MFKKLACTEIGGGGAGIESARYDFERFLPLKKSKKGGMP